MKINKLILLSTFLFINCFAYDVPKKSIYDKRVVSTFYNENDVVQVLAQNGKTTILKFEDDEEIKDLGSGFNDGWDLQPKSNYVWIKPKAYVSKFATNEMGETVNKSIIIEPNKIDWTTNLIVVTNKRDYLFKLVLANNEVYYKVSFNYPAQEQKEKEQEEIKKVQELEQKEIIQELNKTTVPRNWDYYQNMNKGSENILPTYAYDDGIFTYFGFDSTKDIPSVFLFENDKESILNTNIKKDGNFTVLVIHKTAEKMILRSGKRIIGVLNGSYGVNPLPKTQTTISNKIEREIIENE